MRTLLENATDGVITLNEAGAIKAWNSAATSLFGWTLKEAKGQDFFSLVLPQAAVEEHRQMLSSSINASDDDLIGQSIEMHALRRQEAPILVQLTCSALQSPLGLEFLLVCHDIGERKRLEQRLRDMAMRDALTGLPNRAAFIEEADRALARADRHLHSMAVLHMDLDGFKQINDVHGHEAGDQALKAFAWRVQTCLRRSDLLARMGGDEFLVLAEGIGTEAEAQALIGKINAALAPPEDLGNLVSVCLRASIGVALYTGTGNTDLLLKEAADAMCREKQYRAQSPADSSSVMPG